MARISPYAALAVLVAALVATPVVIAQAGAPASPAITTAQTSGGNAAADLDQCRNGPMSDPVVCTGSAWVNGNANAIQAHYLEGDSIVYRMRFDNLALTSHTVTIEWDSTQNGKHAIDYLTTYNRTEVGATPCSGVAGCAGATTFPIPVDPFVAADGVSQVPGVFTMYNGTITGASAYVRAGSFAGNSQTSITITFTAANATPVLAWSGHISTRADWGFDNSAVAISGSPYHMRLLDLDGQGGNQDRSLSTDAVVFPATITIVKDALPDDATSFPFTASGAEMSPASFGLVDDGVHPAARTRTFADLANFGSSRTITEGALPTGWALTNVHCSIATPSGTKLGTVTPDGDGAGPTATFDLEEGNAATCTFTNQFTKGNTETSTAIHTGEDHATSVTSVPLGSTVHDSATVSGTGFGAPTGQVTFAWYATNDTCTGTPANAGTVALTAAVADPSTSFGPLSAGSYSFKAAYAGDSNYDASDAACEPLHVSKADTTLVTSIHAGSDHTTSLTSAPLGSTVHDSATVSGTGYGAPTGDVTFTWFTDRDDCTGPSADAGTVTLVGGVAHPSMSFGPLPAGAYSFRAHYGGDANYNESDADCEPLRVTKADSTSVTSIHAGDDHSTSVTSVPLGSTVHDSAIVSGNAFGAPTGDVTFTWYTTASDCTGPADAAGTVTLVAGVADPSTSFGPLAAGEYSFRAHYAGDANYRPSDAACEPLTVTKASTRTVTEIHDGDEHVVTSVAAGATVHDLATVSGTGLGTPTGSVAFVWFANGSCDGTGTAAGTAELSAGIAHPSDTRGPLAVGSYSFRASYAGDRNYESSVGECEPLDVVKADASALTTIRDGADDSVAVTSVGLGATVHDEATVTGTALGAPTGTVTFTWYSTASDCSGPSTDAGTVPLVGGHASPSTSFGPLGAGQYSFRAHYNGDTNYRAADAACEPLSVDKADTSTSTVVHEGNDHDTSVDAVPLGSSVHDSATVTGTAFGAPTGTVTFTWFTERDDCTGASTAAGTVTLVSGTAHPSDTFGPLAAGTYSFRAVYNGDANYGASTGPCERLTVRKAASSTLTVIHRDGEHTNAVTSVPLGSSVHDRATVSGTGFAIPTGTVSFRWFTNGNCDGEGVAAGIVPLSAGVADPSSTEGPLAAGSYSFRATYDGDANYRPSVGDCEPLTVEKGDVTAVTTIHDGSHHAITTVERGATVHDEALVRGTPFGMPTGTVSFRWFSNGTCAGDGSAAGTLDLVDGLAHASETRVPNSGGQFSFRATYGGDANYRGAAAACEPLAVTAVDLAITKTDGGARPVVGQNTFTYTLEVDNLGPSDALSDATVVDVLPAEVEFVSYGALADGVTCESPSGRSLTCSVVNELLAVNDPPVQIAVVVRVVAGTTVAAITNVAIVTSPDDEAPCDVSATAITCNPSDTNNFASVTTPLTSVAGAVTESRSPGLAFTGSEGGRLAILGVVLVAVGGGCLVGARRRRARAR
jgi:uncharacterized repeat protein (TIGR01451 family)